MHTIFYVNAFNFVMLLQMFWFILVEHQEIWQDEE
jgi:hypothetical protein